MLTFLRSSSQVLVMISSMSVPICNHLHSRQADKGKITFKVGAPLSRPREKPSPSVMKFCREILETLSYGTKQKSLSHTASKWYRVVTDRQTDRRMDGRTYREN